MPPSRPTPIISAAYSPDGKTIAYVIGDSLFLRSEDGTSRPLQRIVEASVCTWSPNGTLLACGSGNAQALTVGGAFAVGPPSNAGSQTAGPSVARSVGIAMAALTDDPTVGGSTSSPTGTGPETSTRSACPVLASPAAIRCG